MQKNPPNSLECHHPKKCITGRTLNATLRLQHSQARDNMTTSTGISLIEYIITHRGAHVQQIRMQHLHVCIHHKLFIQHNRNLRIMTVYIIFTINILHFCLGVRESSTSVEFCTFSADLTMATWTPRCQRNNQNLTFGIGLRWI